jgi:hypothetical protein
MSSMSFLSPPPCFSLSFSLSLSLSLSHTHTLCGCDILCLSIPQCIFPKVDVLLNTVQWSKSGNCTDTGCCLCHRPIQISPADPTGKILDVYNPCGFCLHFPDSKGGWAWPILVGLGFLFGNHLLSPWQLSVATLCTYGGYCPTGPPCAPLPMIQGLCLTLS